MGDYIKFWKFGLDTPFRVLPSNTWYLYDPIVITQDAQVMATSQGSKVLHFWGVENGEFLGRKGFRYEIEAITFSPDGRLLAITDSNGLIHLWGVKSELE